MLFSFDPCSSDRCKTATVDHFLILQFGQSSAYVCGKEFAIILESAFSR